MIALVVDATGTSYALIAMLMYRYFDLLYKIIVLL